MKKVNKIFRFTLLIAAAFSFGMTTVHAQCTTVTSVAITSPTGTFVNRQLDCAGAPKGSSTLRFEAAATGGAPITYEWYVDGALVKNGLDDFYDLDVSAAGSHLVYVAARNACTPTNTVKSRFITVLVIQDKSRLSVDPTSLNFAYDDNGNGDSQPVTVTSCVPWTVVNNLPGWLTASTMSGTTGTSFDVYPNSVNSTSAPRTATITVTAGSSTDSVKVTQAMSPPVVMNFTVSASSASANGNHAATSSNFSLTLPRNAGSPQTITLTGLVSGTNVTDMTNWTPNGLNSSWGAAAGNSQTYIVTIPANTIGTMTVTAIPTDNPSHTPIVITISCVDFRLYYSEGNTTYGSNTIPYVPVTTYYTFPTSSAIAGPAIMSATFTINLTSPIISGGTGYQGTARHFSTYNQTTTAASNQIWSISQTGVGASLYTGDLSNSPTAYNGTARSDIGLLIPNGYVGTITLTCGPYTVTVNVTANRPRSSTVEVGETFAEAGVEWRVLAKGTGVNGGATGVATNALIIAEHVLFDQQIHSSNAHWVTSELRDQLQGGGSVSGTARIWYDNLGATFTNSIVPTTIWTYSYYSSTYQSLAGHKFFLLSVEEINRGVSFVGYAGNTTYNLYPDVSLLADIHARKATTFASGSNWWWTRSPYVLTTSSYLMNRTNGNLQGYTDPTTSQGVRPACVVNLY